MVTLKICNISYRLADTLSRFLDNGNEQIDRHSAPDLSFDRVLRSTKEDFDSQMLLNPFEDQFDLPAATIKFCDGQSRQMVISPNCTLKNNCIENVFTHRCDKTSC